MSIQTIQIIDNGLKTKMGHHFNYDKAIVHASKRRGIDVAVWGDSSLTDIDILEIARPHFRHYLYASTLDGDLESSVALHVDDIQSVLDSSNAEDPIFIPNLLNVEILALRQLLLEKDFKNPLSLVVRYRENVDGGPNSSLFLDSLRAVCNLHSSTMVFADTHALVQTLINNGIKAKLINFPIEIPYSDLKFDDRFDFAYIGQAAQQKGFYHVVNALYLGAQIGYSPRVAIQATGLDLSTLATLKERLPYVVWIAGELDAVSYYQLIASSDTVFVYYDPGKYPVNSSNILIEALALNRRVLTSPFPHAEELLEEDFSMFSTVEYNQTTLLHKMIEMGGNNYLPRSYLKRTDHARNLANTNLLIDLVLSQ